MLKLYLRSVRWERSKIGLENFDSMMALVQLYPAAVLASISQAPDLESLSVPPVQKRVSI